MSAGATERGRPLRVKTSERVAIVGKTGSGKTYFARHLLRPAPRLIVADVKGTIDPAEWALDPLPMAKGLARLEAGKPARIRVPNLLSAQAWEDFFWNVYRLRNVVLYLDEVYAIGPPVGSPGLRALYTRGRELGIGVVASTQRPRYIPGFILSEAEWLVAFQTRMPQDAELLTQLTGLIIAPPLTGHQLILYNDRVGAIRYNGGVHVVAAATVAPAAAPTGAGVAARG